MKITLGKFTFSITIGETDPLANVEQILLIRHGLSQGNTGEQDPLEIGDHNLDLSKDGRLQAKALGEAIGTKFLEESLVYCSPYKRTRETAKRILSGAKTQGIKLYEDPRLREVEHGYESVEAQEAKRKIHGWFYYRFDGGESPADCFDRSSDALESILRQVSRKKKKNIVIVTHGLTIRCILARFLHLTVEQFESLANPGNCDIITIAPTHTLQKPKFTCGRWGVEGIKTRRREK